LNFRFILHEKKVKTSKNETSRKNPDASLALS